MALKRPQTVLKGAETRLQRIHELDRQREKYAGDLQQAKQRCEVAQEELRGARFSAFSPLSASFFVVFLMVFGGFRPGNPQFLAFFIPFPSIFGRLFGGRESQMAQLKRSIADVRAKWAQQKNLYEAVRTDKNLYSKNLVESLEEINEMRKKFKAFDLFKENRWDVDGKPYKVDGKAMEIDGKSHEHPSKKGRKGPKIAGDVPPDRAIEGGDQGEGPGDDRGALQAPEHQQGAIEIHEFSSI